MRSWLPAVAVGGALTLIALGALAVMQPGGEPTAAARADALARELRCPDCQGLSVADSPTASAQEIRRQIEALVSDAATDDEVRGHFVARYGQWIRLAPTSPVTWIVPFVVVLAGVGALGAWLASRGRPRQHASDAGPSSEERRMLREEAEALDA